MEKNYRHLGIFSDIVEEAGRQATLLPLARPGPETQQKVREVLGWCNLPEQPVPAGHMFVLGDNRWNSLDSRSFGFVPTASLIGEVKIVFWSREFELIPPSLEKPQGDEQWGAIRWDRMGKAIR